jgi:hypothetical protein
VVSDRLDVDGVEQLVERPVKVWGLARKKPKEFSTGRRGGVTIAAIGRVER